MTDLFITKIGKDGEPYSLVWRNMDGDKEEKPTLAELEEAAITERMQRLAGRIVR